MADALGQHTVSPHLLGLAHLLGMGLQLVHHVLDLCQTAYGVLGHGVAQLAHTQFHIVEVGDGLA